MSHKITSVFLHRRTLTVTQVLATNDPERGIYALCDYWHIPRQADFVATLQAVAQHAIEYDRQQRKEAS